MPRAFLPVRPCSPSFISCSIANVRHSPRLNTERSSSRRTNCPAPLQQCGPSCGRSSSPGTGSTPPTPCLRRSGPSGGGAHPRRSVVSPPMCSLHSTIASWLTSARSCSFRFFGGRRPSYEWPTSMRLSSAPTPPIPRFAAGRNRRVARWPRSTAPASVISVWRRGPPARPRCAPRSTDRRSD